MSASPSYLSIAALPHLEPDLNLSSLLSGGIVSASGAVTLSEDLAMERLRRVMLTEGLLEDDTISIGGGCLGALQETAMDYSDCDLPLAVETSDLFKLSRMTLHSEAGSDPNLQQGRAPMDDDGYHGDEEGILLTELTASHYGQFSACSDGDSDCLDLDLSDSVSSGSDSGLDCPLSGVRWEMIAESTAVTLSINPDGPLPPVSDILMHRGRPKDDFLGLSNRRPSTPVVVKTEFPGSEDDSCSLAPHFLTYHPLHHHHLHQDHNHNCHASTTSATSSSSSSSPTNLALNINNNNSKDQISNNTNNCGNTEKEAVVVVAREGSRVDENNNPVPAASGSFRGGRRTSGSKAARASSSSSSSGLEKGERKKPGRKKGQVSKVLHLWEFIRDLLNDPITNPRIINWENEPDGVFRVLQSSEVARLWGEKKKNKRVMTYEKLSRSLRYSRKEGYFDSLPKDKGYPKKLCFKFGPKSHGWKELTCTS